VLLEPESHTALGNATTQLLTLGQCPWFPCGCRFRFSGAFPIELRLHGWGGRSRTSNNTGQSRVLYRLSYAPRISPSEERHLGHQDAREPLVALRQPPDRDHVPDVEPLVGMQQVRGVGLQPELGAVVQVPQVRVAVGPLAVQPPRPLDQLAALGHDEVLPVSGRWPSSRALR
jgi:hypothetical protein